MSDKVRILYMEDNEGTARLLEKRLARAGYTIDIAPNGDIGLERCAAHPYDVIIVDYNMPGLNGLQVIQHLVDQGIVPPTIMLTGTGNERIAVEALKIGASDYLVKDIDGVYFDLLPTVIEQALNNRQLLEDKHRAEEALKRSEQYYRALIENSLDLIALTDNQGFIRYVSPSIRSMFGYSESELMGQSGLHLIDPEGAGLLDPQFYHDTLNFYTKLIETPGQLVETQMRMRLRDGSWHWLEVRGRNLLQEPWIESIVFNIRDITERKQMETALYESEEQFRLLFEQAPDPYFVADLAGNLVDCNHAVEPLLGLSIHDIIGKNFVEMGLFTPDQLGVITEILVKVPEGTFTKPPELTVTRPDGVEIVFDLRMMPIQIKGQMQILGIGHDITWLKQAETQMKAHIQRLEILRQIDDELTRRLDIQYVQTMALDSMMTVSSATAGSIALINGAKVSSVHSVGYPEAANQNYSLDGRSIAARVSRRREAEWVKDVTTDPDYFQVLADACSQITIPLVSQERLIGIASLETNRPERFTAEMFEFLKLIATRIAVAIDNAQLYASSQTQLVQLQTLYEQISALEQRKTDMVRIVSHDLRNPLSVISTSSFLLERSMGSLIAENQQQYLAQINHALDRMKTLTTDVLSLENIEQMARGEISTDSMNLLELIRDSVESSRPQTERNHQVLSFDYSGGAIMIQGNKTELQQAVSNLIDNAIKYTPEGGSIDVSLQRQDGRLRFEVVDTGYGIPEADQADLFQPFKRIITGETRSIEGTGLGLYIVKKIIERNHGEIIFSSEYGKGSMFGFILPLSPE